MGFRSPNGPSFFDLLTSQAQCTVEAVKLLAAMFGASKEERVALRDQLHRCEHKGDELNHELIRRINQSFVTPFDREDLSRLAARLDDCLDNIDEAGDYIVLYGIDHLPDDLETLMNAQINVLTRCADQTASALPGLSDPPGLRDYWVEINRLENEGDLDYRRTLTCLFDCGLDAIQVIKLKDIIEILERSVDCFEDLANTIESIAVKES